MGERDLGMERWDICSDWVKGTWEWKDGIYTAMGERDLGMERWDIYSDG